MPMSMVLGQEAVFNDALSLLDSHRRTNKVRSPTFTLLVVLLYYRSGAGHEPTIPMLSEPGQGIKRKELELAADALFTKTAPSDPDKPVIMLLTGNWLKSSERPEQNTWRNAMDTQAGLGCAASNAELSDLSFVIAERSDCPHRDEETRTCTLNGARCHNPTKKGGSGLTSLPSLPKILKEQDGFYITSLAPEAISRCIDKAAERIPAYPFLYALYNSAHLFEDRATVDLGAFASDFAIAEDSINALFDTDPASPLNA